MQNSNLGFDVITMKKRSEVTFTTVIQLHNKQLRPLLEPLMGDSQEPLSLHLGDLWGKQNKS